MLTPMRVLLKEVVNKSARLCDEQTTDHQSKAKRREVMASGVKLEADPATEHNQRRFNKREYDNEWYHG
tara:strand:+ start:204 stop:410 length:207 start_codon:yes stop_codon:yes gene_type:complete